MLILCKLLSQLGLTTGSFWPNANGAEDSDGGNATAATRRRQHNGGGVTAAGIDTDNNQLKAVAEAAGAEILVAMATT